MKIVDTVKYNEHQWKICPGLKVIAPFKGEVDGVHKKYVFHCDKT